MPTKIYVKSILELYEKDIIKSCAHITGGGIIENLPRILPNNLQSKVNLNKWKLSKLYKWIMSQGVSEKEMLKTFNCGYGMVVLIQKNKLNSLYRILKKHKLKSNILGRIEKKKKSEKKDVVFTGSL